MEPYTTEGVGRREHLQPETTDNESCGSLSDISVTLSSTSLQSLPSVEINYELVGVIVHSGQANAGHYYSYVKDRRFVALY